jgi:hypothetical protein
MPATQCATHWRVVSEGEKPIVLGCGKGCRMEGSFRLIGELLAAAIADVLPSFGRSVPSIRLAPGLAANVRHVDANISADTTSCDSGSGVLLVRQWHLRKVSPIMWDWCGLGANTRPASHWRLCNDRRRHIDKDRRERDHVYGCTALLPCTQRVRNAVAGMFVFDYLLWNENRWNSYEWLVERSWHGKRATNVFLRAQAERSPSGSCASEAQDQPREARAGDTLTDVNASDLPFAFIDNEFAAHASTRAVCSGFPEYHRHASFLAFVTNVVGPAAPEPTMREPSMSRSDTSACPLGGELLAELRRYAHGASFSNAIIAAMGPSRARCVLRRWAAVYSGPNCPEFPAYLDARFDALADGMRRWHCVV